MTLEVRGEIVVDDFAVEIELAVERGETVALVGPNGAGKSTVLRAIAGLCPLASGHLRFDGVVWDDPSAGVSLAARHRRVGAVFQQYLLFEHLSALDNVAFGLRARQVDRRQARAAAVAALDRLGLGGIANQRPAALSGGQAQRVALARAIVIAPSVVLLDEPLAALDVSSRSAVRHDLPSWLADSRAVDGGPSARIVVTHDPVDADVLADRVVVLEAGRVTQAGSVADLAVRPRSTYVADLMGTNIVHGTLHGSSLDVASADGTRHELIVGAHEANDGPAIAAIRPAAISLHRSRPEGSPRNVWETTIVGVDQSSGRVRVRLGAPLTFVAEVTEAGLDALGAAVGTRVWVAVKASEISVVTDI